MPPLDLEAVPSAVPVRLRTRGWRLGLLVVALLVAGGIATSLGVYMFGKRPLPPSGGMYFFRRVELSVPLYLQGDPAWGKDFLGNAPRTLGQVGCAVSSAAMVMKFYGIDTDPGRLNVFLRENGGYDEDNDLRWEGPAALAPTQVRHVYEDLPSYYLIDTNLLHGNPVIVRLHLPSGWTHFVVIMGKQGLDYLIRDPSGAGRTKGVYPLKDYGRNIEALRYYEKISG